MGVTNALQSSLLLGKKQRKERKNVGYSSGHHFYKKAVQKSKKSVCCWKPLNLCGGCTASKKDYDSYYYNSHSQTESESRARFPSNWFLRMTKGNFFVFQCFERLSRFSLTFECIYHPTKNKWSPFFAAEKTLVNNYDDMWNVVLPIYGTLRKSFYLSIQL